MKWERGAEGGARSESRGVMNLSWEGHDLSYPQKVPSGSKGKSAAETASSPEGLCHFLA